MTKLEKVVLGGGCFWCLDAAFRQIKGVERVVAGYAGGTDGEPTYEKVCGGNTGHAEVVEVWYDPKIIAYEDVLDIFWAVHDPTQLNRQGNDVGTQYRSVIFFYDDVQRQLAEDSAMRVGQLWDKPIVTEIKKLEHFYPAEEYHQNYFAKNPEQGYCQVVINPKLQKLREKFEARLRDIPI